MAGDGRHRLLKNAVAGAVQTVASGLMLIVLYRLLLDGVGSTGLGLWSLLVALFGLARVLEFGLTGSGMKLTAEAIAEGRFGDARNFTRFAILGTALTTLLSSLVLAAVIPMFADVGTVSSWELLAIGSGTWIGFLVQSLRSSIDAMQRADLRHLTITFQALIMLALCWSLIPGHGWNGLVTAYLLCSCITGLFTAAILWWLWRDVSRERPSSPMTAQLKRMMEYGVPFHLTTISAQFYDPVTKYFLAVFGSLADVGLYEMASRMVLQLRGLLVSAMEALVPYVAGSAPIDRAKGIGYVYFPAIRMFMVIGIPLFAAFLAAIPCITEWWLGVIDQRFVLLSQVLALAWAFNVLTTPAYFCAQGQGRQRWNLGSHILIAVANLGLAVALGSLCGPLGVVAAFCLALVAGSLLLMVGFHHDNRLRIAGIGLSRSLAMPAVALFVGGALAACWWVLPSNRQEIQIAGFVAALLIGASPIADGTVRSLFLRLWRRKAA